MKIEEFTPKDLVDIYSKWGIGEIDCRIEHGFKDKQFYIDAIDYLIESKKSKELLIYLIKKCG